MKSQKLQKSQKSPFSFYIFPSSFILLIFLPLVVFNGCAHQVFPFKGKHYKKTAIHVPFAKKFRRNAYEAKAPNFMITSQGNQATQAGIKIMERGGNVVDAAVAVSFTIAVEQPQSTGIGGGGFMLLHLIKGNKTFAVDFREKAPMLAHRDMYLDKAGNVIPQLSLNGALSVGVPGMVAGVLEIQEKYGNLARQQILEPAIQLAEKGFPVNPELAKAIKAYQDVLAKYPSSKKIFFRKDGQSPLQEGDLLVQKDLANTLKRIARHGKAGFYKGPVAKKILTSMRQHKGLIRKRDLDHYNVKWRIPVWGTFRDLKIASMPPPSSGGIHLLQILSILEKDNLKEEGIYSAKSIHLTASAMQRAFADRATYLGDSDFVKVPVQGLTAKKYALKLRQSIMDHQATSSKEVKAGQPWPFNNPYESPETTHFTIMDKDGNAVSSTQTINYYFWFRACGRRHRYCTK